MRTEGTPADLERRRVLAVTRVQEGYSCQEVADFLGVDASSVRRWLAAFQRQGVEGLAARPSSGRPPKLTHGQEKLVRRWLGESPLEHGFTTALWSAPRLARLVQEEWGITLNPRYLADWLRQRGFSPQKPRRRAREQAVGAVERWLAGDWPRIKKRPAATRRVSCRWTKAAC
jgi:transposase